MAITKYMIHELAFPVDGTYWYDVQRCTIVDNMAVYCGGGVFCRTKEEAEEYKAVMEAAERVAEEHGPDETEVAEKAEEREPEPAKPLDGTYYYFDCMNAFVNNGLFPAREFSGDEEAIKMAADYEATLYKYEIADGVKTGSSILYDPGDCFG